MFSKLKYCIRNYFGFSRAQTHGVVVLLLFLVIALAVPILLREYAIYEQKKDALQSVAILDAWVTELEKTKGSKKHQTSSLPTRKNLLFDINKATEGDLQKLYGIGPVRAKRIITYRDRLGGFVDAEQYNEVYNLPAEVVSRLQEQSFISPDFKPKKIDLNKASFQALAYHPYLTYSQAKAITAYKDQHGTFDSVQDVKKVKCINSSTLKKLLPYLTTGS